MTTSQSVDPNAFRAFEHAGWQKVASSYNDVFARLTTQAVDPLLDAVGARQGVSLLDVATGPGFVAAAAAQRGSTTTGLDFSSAMVSEAHRLYPTVEFREGDAEDLPFPGSSFDAVVMNFGLLHLGRPEQGLREAHRVLHPGGRIGFTVWDKPEAAVGFGMVLSAIQTHGNLNVPLPPGPPFFRFSDPLECSRVLLEVGFVSPQSVRTPQVWRLRSPDEVFAAMQGSTVRTAGLLRAQSPEALEKIRAALRDQVRAYQKGDLFEIPMPAVLTSAVKP